MLTAQSSFQTLFQASSQSCYFPIAYKKEEHVNREISFIEKDMINSSFAWESAQFRYRGVDNHMMSWYQAWYDIIIDTVDPEGQTHSLTVSLHGMTPLLKFWRVVITAMLVCFAGEPRRKNNLPLQKDWNFKRSRQNISRIGNQWRKIEFFFYFAKTSLSVY